MGDRSFNCLELVLVTVSAPVLIVCGVQFKEGFEFVGRSGFSLLDQGLLHLCKTIAEAGGVDEAHDRRRMDTDADFPQPLIGLNGGVMEKLLGLEGVQFHCKRRPGHS